MANKWCYVRSGEVAAGATGGKQRNPLETMQPAYALQQVTKIGK